MQIRQVVIERFRGIQKATLHPGPRTVLIGPNNSGKSTILEALDLVLHPGLGRPRPVPGELDYYGRDPSHGFSIEVVIGDLSEPLRADALDHLEGWDAEKREVVVEPDHEGCEAIVRVRAVGSPDFDLSHEFAKPESNSARFGPGLRRHVGWFFDGRARDPAWQMVFHRGGVLDRLFNGVDLSPGLNLLRDGLRKGASDFTSDAAVTIVLAAIAKDLDALEVLDRTDPPSFETGGVSEREMLQTLRLALPVLPDVSIPLREQGRGVQRLVLLAALLRLAGQPDAPTPIGAFEEPEEALEPMRQAQVAAMVTDLADKGGQVFVVSHSADIVRAFGSDGVHLVSVQPRGTTLSLRDKLSERTRQGYERRLDGPVVQALFARVPVLVEGPSDRACFAVFWDRLAKDKIVAARYAHALDFINCESGSHQPEIARLLHEAGKPVVAWAETDTRHELKRLRDETNCSALVIYPDDSDRENLEAELSTSCSIEALAAGMDTVATTRGYTWEEQRNDLLSRCSPDVPREQRDKLKASTSVEEALASLDEPYARRLVRSALDPKHVAPFEMKGARPARLMAEAIVQIDGVPEAYSRAMRGLHGWIALECPPGKNEITMAG